MTESPQSLTDSLQPDLERVEALLSDATSYAEKTIAEPASHLAAAGGKRLRPMLTLMTSLLGDGVNDDVRTAAVIVELTHLATLYHDDVMDSATMRRGAPAAHELWGNTVAILTGDLLFAKASQLVAELGPEALRIHAETFERLCLGQLHETIGPSEGADRIAHYLDVLAGKTGSLIATSARYGALFGGAPAEVVEAMAEFGEKVGIAFQIADDVIDLSADAEVTGKNPGTDLREGVDTMPVLLLRRDEVAGTLDEDGRRVLELLEEDLESDERLGRAVALLRTHPVVDETREMARAWANDAIAELDGVPAGELRDTLRDFALQLVDRLA